MIWCESVPPYESGERNQVYTVKYRRRTKNGFGGLKSGLGDFFDFSPQNLKIIWSIFFFEMVMKLENNGTIEKILSPTKSLDSWLFIDAIRCPRWLLKTQMVAPFWKARKIWRLSFFCSNSMKLVFLVFFYNNALFYNEMKCTFNDRFDTGIAPTDSWDRQLFVAERIFWNE